MEQVTENRPIVLYVDDIKANLMLFKASFDNIFNVVLAESGMEAIKVLKESEVQVIVSDQNMPGMTGNELLEIVTKEYPDVMRFMITAYTDYETVVESINKGHLYGFFNKPYNIDDVKHSIDNSLEVRNLRIKNREMVEKLEKAKDVMVSYERSKTKFLASLTDEIRTPINKIMTAVHMIKDKIDSKELTELLQLLDVSVRRLEGYSESAKHLVHLQDPEFQLNAESVSLQEIIEVGVIERGNIMHSENIELTFAETAEDYSVMGEYDLLQASFSSLLGFTIDHTDEGSDILVDINNSGEEVSLKISTEGYSYSEKEKGNLLVLFSDKEGEIERDMCMELVLVKEIMNAHRGRLMFLDGGKRCGFSMLFPK